MFKYPVLWLPLAFVLGGLVGAWGPGEELRARKAHVAQASEAQKKPRAFDAFARMINLPARAGRRHAPVRAVASSNVVSKTAVPVKKDESAGNESEAVSTPASDTPRRMEPEDLRARIEEAAELWRTRSELVRADTVKKLGLDADGEARFDDAVVRMNEEIRASVQAIADALADEDVLTPELGVRLMGDLSVTMAETYDRIGACTDADRRDDVSRLQLIELVDPSVAEPLIAVQDKLEAVAPRRSWR